MNTAAPYRERLVLIGAGGHARVLLALVRAAGHEVVGVCDPALARDGRTIWEDVPVLGGDDALLTLDREQVAAINGIGQLVGSSLRRRVFERVQALGYRFPALVHPTAWVAKDVRLDDGVQIMAGAVVQPGSRIGASTIVNTRAGIDHDCVIGAHVHIAPGATLCGGVAVGEGGFIGAGATLIQGVRVGDHAVVGAGATLVKALRDNGKVLGGPPGFWRPTVPIE
jgi:sugar O-acyltransferase (sialic acid O-acetyltransferase NeuD family)